MTTSGIIPIEPPATRLEASTMLRTKSSSVSYRPLVMNGSYLLRNLTYSCFVIETHLTDQEIERIRKTQENDARKQLHVEAREEARLRTKARALERQAMQFKANQAMNEAELEYAGEMSI